MKKLNKELREMLEIILAANSIKEGESSSEEGGESFLEKNARESNKIAANNFQVAIREAERDRYLKEMRIQLAKVTKKIENYEKRIEKTERKLISLQDKMLKQKEWTYDVDNNIKTLNKEVKKQGKDIFRIKNIFKAACHASGVQQSDQFKKIAKRMIKFYNKVTKQKNKENISSYENILQIQNKEGYNI